MPLWVLFIIPVFALCFCSVSLLWPFLSHGLEIVSMLRIVALGIVPVLLTCCLSLTSNSIYLSFPNSISLFLVSTDSTFLILFPAISLFSLSSTLNLFFDNLFYVPSARKLVFSLQSTVAQCSTFRQKGMKCKN